MSKYIHKSHNVSVLIVILGSKSQTWVSWYKWRTQVVEGEVLDKKHSSHLYEVWDEYISWARLNKISWRDDLDRLKKHIAPPTVI